MTGIWTVILAAGSASRFGSPKALATWNNGQTLLERAINSAPQVENIVVVTGAHHEAISASLSETQYVLNNNWEAGMGSSIAYGIKHVFQNKGDMALIVPVDQPFITRSYLQEIAAQCGNENRCILTLDHEIIGPPAAVPKHYFNQLFSLKSEGLKVALRDYGLCEGRNILRDIDTPQDLERFSQTSNRDGI